MEFPVDDMPMHLYETKCINPDVLFDKTQEATPQVDMELLDYTLQQVIINDDGPRRKILFFGDIKDNELCKFFNDHTSHKCNRDTLRKRLNIY